MKIISLICAAFLLIAIADMPHGYYTFLRVVVTIGAFANARVSYDDEKQIPDAWVFVFGIIVILYNPVIPIHFERAVWAPINILTAILFAVKAFGKN